MCVCSSDGSVYRLSVYRLIGSVYRYRTDLEPIPNLNSVYIPNSYRFQYRLEIGIEIGIIPISYQFQYRFDFGIEIGIIPISIPILSSVLKSVSYRYQSEVAAGSLNMGASSTE